MISIPFLKRPQRAAAFCFFASLLFCSVDVFRAAQAQEVKKPNVAGAFYPAQEASLRRMIQRYLREAEWVRIEGDPLVLIAPHAGYVYSGPVAAFGFKALLGRQYDTVVVLAASHYFAYQGASVFREGLFRTPLGDLEIDKEFASALLEEAPGLLSFEPGYFEREHSLEVELPFLQETLKAPFKIVPILMGAMSYEECRALSDLLSRLAEGRSVLLVVSTDLSHYQPYDEAVEYDRTTIDFIRDLDARGLWKTAAPVSWNVCGLRPVITGLIYARNVGARSVQVLKYANSGDTAGERSRVVGYVSVVLSEGALEQQETRGAIKGDEMFTKDEQKRLLEIARSSMEAHVLGNGVAVEREEYPRLNQKMGAFVTLRKNGRLRGCIGSLTAAGPLCVVVSRMAVEACSRDQRFPPVSSDELDEIDVEISVLSEPQRIDDWRDIRLGVDGVIIRRGPGSGVFLPQVATETGWDRETFLGQLCSQKLRLASDCYKDPLTQIYTFQAEVFSESELEQ